MRAAAEWSFNTGALRELLLSHNPQLAGNISAWSLPSSLAALHIANTSISGSLDSDWLSRQGPWLDCLVGYNTPGLCGTLAEGLPCSIVNFTDGTALGELHGRLCARLHSCVWSCSCLQSLVCCCSNSCLVLLRLQGGAAPTPALHWRCQRSAGPAHPAA